MKYLIPLMLLMAGCTTLSNRPEVQEKRRAEYIHAVVRGAGYLPWQKEGVSKEEIVFRAEIEARKDALLARRTVAHPSYYDDAAMARARENVGQHKWAQDWLVSEIAVADYVAAQPLSWVESMLPWEAPAHAYGFTCPTCVGVKSQEGTGYRLISWNYKNPDVFTCDRCGTAFPNAKYPETVTLQLPRIGHAVSYYMNPAEQANPDNRTGALAWHWVGYPMHMSFTGIVRENKIKFMRNAAHSLAIAWLFTEDPKYALAAREIMTRYAERYRQWPYRDYWDTYADCDPLYAAWHDRGFPMTWKRHLSESAYASDTFEAASMLQNYWGAGRIHPSTDTISGLIHFIKAYDLTFNALDGEGNAVWDEDARRLVERDLLLEAAMGAEPYLGGHGKADRDNNKTPRIYNAFATLGKCLGIPEYVDVALRGYEGVRDASFNYDGFSTESPSYTNMYLAQLLVVPESLHSYSWPEDFVVRSGTVDLYGQDQRLRLMYESVLDTLLPNGEYLPLSDTRLNSKPSVHVLQMGMRRYPDTFAGVLPNIHPNTRNEYAVFNLTDEERNADRPLDRPETLYPAWKTAILRHGEGADADTMTLVFNPEGGHRHQDNLALFYNDGGRTALGDLGYLGDMPVNWWIRSTESHNLVVVDQGVQKFKERTTTFEFMATSPLASVVEATSAAYAQCSDYRRRVVLVKTGVNETFAIDLFTVSGGNEHRYRIYSELASSDAPEGHLVFDGVTMPEEAPLPEVGASLAEADIYGLRDVRSTVPTTNNWQATWSEKAGGYRLWMASPSDRVEAANGPGQRTPDEEGRRVRYVDAVRAGENLQSAFVAVHEPLGGSGAIQTVERISVNAGPAAVAVKITRGGDSWLALNNFETAQRVEGVDFQGMFTLVHRPKRGPARYLAVGASRLEIDGELVFSGTPVWRTAVDTSTDDYLQGTTPPPADWRVSAEPLGAYARIKSGDDWTGIPVGEIQRDGKVSVKRFPLPEVESVEIQMGIYGTL